ncbi:MAG: Trm112 family protein [Candidatus Promineifilaceae bacterium]
MSANGASDLPISSELLEILRCPLAVQNKTSYGADPGRLELVHNTWLVSADSGLKYPIRDGIPIMLIDEGQKWKNTAIEDLPVPPPAAESGGSGSDEGSTSGASGNSAEAGGVSPMMLAGLLAVFIAVVVMFRGHN